MSSLLIPQVFSYNGYEYTLLDRTDTLALYAQRDTDYPPTCQPMGYQLIRVKQTRQDLVGGRSIVMREALNCADIFHLNYLYSASQLEQATFHLHQPQPC